MAHMCLMQKILNTLLLVKNKNEKTTTIYNSSFITDEYVIDKCIGQTNTVS